MTYLIIAGGVWFAISLIAVVAFCLVTKKAAPTPSVLDTSIPDLPEVIHYESHREVPVERIPEHHILAVNVPA